MTSDPKTPMSNSPDPQVSNPAPLTSKITRLCDEDAATLDALLAARAAGADTGPAPAGSAERREQLERLLGLLDVGAEDDPTLEPPADLLAATMAKVHEAEQRKRFAEQVEMLASPPPSTGIGLRQVLTAVAVFALSLSLLLPIMERNRQQSVQQHCLSNLAVAGQGFLSYSQDHDGALPRVNTQPGAEWWHIGGTPAAGQGVNTSNTANLHLLIARGYAKAEALNCPSNEFVDDQIIAALGSTTARDWSRSQHVSYSYANQYTPAPILVSEHPGMAILADRNPMWKHSGERLVFDAEQGPMQSSRSHGGKGQNILIGDGSVRWQDSPLIHHAGGEDNIWLLGGAMRYTGTEHAQDGTDSFLAP